jgi:acyl dehydratase
MMSPGDSLTIAEHTIDAPVVQLYAEVAIDFNPIHFDDVAAQRLGFPTRIAHGMISGGVLNRMLTLNFGSEWLQHGQLDLKFIRPVFVGDTVTAGGVVTSTGPTAAEVWVRDSGGRDVIVGTASLHAA